eukprot:TRINITY_DN2682_c0_g1_i3.p1 TRINITY_DN2682_c0_g1~~TRINITY_DN2682_c0_g1_i3.p1  ORF type:complete len:764 (+),score=89.46 TRINITY_DN2682_c0_g1_i3:67-2292(+)
MLFNSFIFMLLIQKLESYHKGVPHGDRNKPERRKYKQTLGCLVVPNFTMALCGTPFELTNYLNERWCPARDEDWYEDNEVYRVPRKIVMEYITDGHHAHSMAAAYPRARVAGTGLSNYEKQFCPEEGFETSAMLTTHTLYVADVYEKGYQAIREALDAEDWDWKPAKLSVDINGKRMQAKVASGLPLRFLLERLSEVKHIKACRINGCTLAGDYPPLVDATVGGLVASGSHGSSISHGSFSNQARDIVVVRGYDVSEKTLQLDRKSHPLWYAAYKTSIGILGLIEYITFDIEPRKLVRRELQKLDLDEFVAGMVSIQSCYAEQVKPKNYTAQQEARALQEIDQHTHFFWIPYSSNIYQLNFTHKEDKISTAWLKNHPNRKRDEKALSQVKQVCKFMEGEIYEAILTSKKNLKKASKHKPAQWKDFTTDKLLNITGKWWLDSKLVDQANNEKWNIINQYIIQSQYKTWDDIPQDKAYQELDPIYRIIDLYKNNGSFNQGWNLPIKYWEISIPLERAGECLQKIQNYFYNGVEYSNFPFPLIIRFQGQEDILLSHSVDGIRMYISTYSWTNWYGLMYRDSGIYRMFEMLYMECDGRLHWTSEAWNVLEQCFDGYDRYGDYWCNFGCALQEIDAEGAWRTQSPIWKFYAEDDSGELLTGPSLTRCCIGGYGFASYKCQCISHPDFQGVRKCLYPEQDEETLEEMQTSEIFSEAAWMFDQGVTLRQEFTHICIMFVVMMILFWLF